MSLRRQWHPTPVFLPGKSHGQRSLLGWSPWGRKESDTTERLHFHFCLSCIGEGNGNPLQCSCLENPKDSGAWWAAVYRVAQSRTRLKRLSISISICDAMDFSDKNTVVGCHFLLQGNLSDPGFEPTSPAAAAVKSFQSCPTLRLWSGLPFPSPMHEREK